MSCSVLLCSVVYVGVSIERLDTVIGHASDLCALYRRAHWKYLSVWPAISLVLEVPKSLLRAIDSGLGWSAPSERRICLEDLRVPVLGKFMHKSRFW
jgi:hypothetical protein